MRTLLLCGLLLLALPAPALAQVYTYIDADGNRVELKIEPATLAIMELEVRFRPGADASRYLPGAKSQAGKTSAPAGATAQPATPIRAEIN